MGFLKGHTLLLSRTLGKQETARELEDVRCSALGNTFHTMVLAVLLSAPCSKEDLVVHAPMAKFRRLWHLWQDFSSLSII